MQEMSKLQIRAKVLAVVAKIKTMTEFSNENLTELYKELEDISDRECMFDIFLKEYIKMNENEFIFSGCLIKELVDMKYVEDKVFEILKSNNYSDDAKYRLVQLLRLSGSKFDYNVIPQYFDNPQEVLDTDTKNLLKNAVYNPETMLDFLDFVSAVQPSDRSVLLQSLKLDYSGDMLANIIYPVLYSDFDDNFKLEVIDILSESKSSLAIAPFNYLIQVSDNKEIINECTTGLKKLKLAGASEQKANEYFKSITKDSKPYSFITTIPDGEGNQAIFISRYNENKDKYLLSAIVINDEKGVIDCFGFYNISKNELQKVKTRFNQSEGEYNVSAAYIKSRLNYAVDLTIKNKRTFPYEFICWNTLTKDIEEDNISFESFIEENLKKDSPNSDEIMSLFTKNYTFRWYIKPSENNILNEFVTEIYNSEETNIDKINLELKEKKDIIIDENILDVWKKRIIQCSYILWENDKKSDANLFYNILNNNDLISLFKYIIIQRSIFNYFIALKEQSKESFLTTNIFRKKQEEKQKFDTKKIENIISKLKKSWINE